MPTQSYLDEVDAQAAANQQEQARQQREADRQQKAADKAQADAAKEAQRIQNDAKEAAYRAQKRPQYVDAHGDIQPTHSDEDWQKMQAEEQAAAAAHDAAAQSGRKFTTSKITKLPIYLESEQQQEAARAAAAEKLRKTKINDQLKANQAGYEYEKQSRSLAKILTDKQQQKLTEDHAAARSALAGALDPQTRELANNSDWIPWNESPTPAAEAAKTTQAALTQPEKTTLSEDELTQFEANDSTKPAAQEIRRIQAQQSGSAAAKKAAAEHAARQTSLILRRDAPDKWQALQRQKIANLSPDELNQHLAASSAEIQNRQQALQDAYAPIEQQSQQTQSQLAALALENEQRRQQGIPAGEIVSYPGPDGQPDHWAKDLAARRETLMAQAQQTEQANAPLVADLQNQQAELQKDIAFHEESVKTAAARQQEQQHTAVKNTYQRLQFTPGMESTVGELQALDAEHASRAATLGMEPGDYPQQARAALDSDIQQRRQAVLESAAGRSIAAGQHYAEIQSQLAANPNLHATAGHLYVAAEKKLAAEQGISEPEARRLIGDAEAHDFNQGTAEDAQKSRLLSNGGILVNPSITKEAAYKAAVESSAGSPEAKAEALARYPDIREQAGRQVLEAITSVSKVLGESSLNDWENWSDWKKKRPKEVSEAEWALRWQENNQSKNTGVLGTLASKTKQFIRNLGSGLNDVAQQAAGVGSAVFSAGGLDAGSRGMLQLAQQFGAQSAAHQTALDLGGHTSDNFLTRGVFSQLPRIGSSIIPVAAATGATMGFLRGFAATPLGARFLPALAAGLEASATPAQALKAVGQLRRSALGAAAAAGGAQTYGAQLTDIYSTLRRENPQMDHTTALRQAQMPAVVSGLATALLTVGFGSSGISRLLTTPAEARRLAAKVFASHMAKLGFVGSEFLKGGMKETVEEGLDEGISQIAAAVGTGHSVQQSVADFLQKTLPEMSVSTMLMGGAGEGITASRESSVSPATAPHLLPETLAAAHAAIEDYASAAAPEHQEPIKNRAQIALHIAQGGDLSDATEQQLNDAGWTARDSKGIQLPDGKLERLKDYTGPAVFNVDASGRATLDPSYRQKLQTELPAVYHAIPESATQPAPAPESATTPAGQTASDGSRPNADSSPVQAPAQPEAQPPAGGSTPAPSGPALDVPPSSTPPSEQDAIATFLQDRGMPVAESARAAAAIMAHPAMQGHDFDWYKKEPTQRTAIHADLGITGSQNSKEKATNPLRFSTAAQPPAPTVNSPSSTKIEDAIKTTQKKLDDSIPGTPEHTSLTARLAKLREKQYSDKASSTPQAADSPSASASAQPPSTTVNAAQQTSATVNSNSPFNGPALNRALHAKEITDTDAARAVQQHTGATTVKDLVAGIQHYLNWTNYQRALTAAASFLEQKTASTIPLATAERSAPAEASAKDGNSAQPPLTTVNGSAATLQPPQTSPVPSSLSKNGAWARAKLATLAKIKDPAQKTWARKFLSTLEEGFAKHHALYDAIGVGSYARSLLDGQMTAVMDIGGKVTRLFDLSAMLAQFDHLADPRAAALATGIEEDIHAATVRLGIQQPEKYGHAALIKQWDALPEDLRKTVWDSYHAARHTQAQSHALPARLTEGNRYHLMHEFLRMLVQDQHFQGRITEATDASPSLITWVQNLLRDLGALLRGFVQSLAGPQRRQIESMVGEIAASLKSIEQASATTTARLESLASLRNPAAVARQTLLKEGLLNPSALNKAFDALPPALKSRTLAQWKKDQPAGAPAKASKADLMRHLLGGMVGSPSEQQAIGELLLPSKSGTSLLRQLLGKLKNLTSDASASTARRRENAPSDTLRSLHVETLRALGGLEGLRFVQSLPGAVQDIFTVAPLSRLEDMLTALREHELQQRAAGLPMFQGAIPSKLLSDLRTIAYQRGEDQASADPSLAASDNSSPKARHKLRQHFLALERQAAYDRGEASVQPPSTTVNAPQEPQPSSTSDRAQAMLDALESHERETASDSPSAAVKLRTKLHLLEVAGIRARFFLRDRAAQELHTAEQAGRQDLPKAQAMLALGTGEIGARRPAGAWRTIGWSERRQLALLGIGVDQHPSEDAGGYPYSLSRLEAAGLRVEFSLAGSPERQQAEDELAWMRQQPAEFQTAVDNQSPAYIERGIAILKQSALEDLAQSYPATAALIRPELEARQSFGLRTDARLPTSRSDASGNPTRPPTRPRSEDTAAPETAQTTAPETTPELPVNSGPGQPPPTTANNSQPPPTSPSQLSFPIPLSRRGQVRRSTFPNLESLEAFQFKLDADTVASARSKPAEVKKAEQRGLSLLARLMEETPLGRSALEQKLLAYHAAVVQQAEAASAFGTFTPPSFQSYSGSDVATPGRTSGNLPAPIGGDIISGLKSQGITRLGPPDASDGWAWYRALQQDASASKLKNTEAQRLARSGDISDAKSRLEWLKQNLVSSTSGRSIDEAAAELSAAEEQLYPVSSGEELGQAILTALEARAREQSSTSPESSPEQQARESTADFLTYVSGSTTGQSFTPRQLARDLSPDEEIQIGSEWFTVLGTDPASGTLTLDSARFGPQTLPDSQPVHVQDGPNHLRIGSDVATPGRTSGLPPPTAAERAALSNALPPGTQRDLLRPSPIESTLKSGTLPPASTQDTAALDADLRSSIDAGNALDASAARISDLDTEDDLAAAADSFLDGDPLAASSRLSPEDQALQNASIDAIFTSLYGRLPEDLPRLTQNHGRDHGRLAQRHLEREVGYRAQALQSPAAGDVRLQSAILADWARDQGLLLTAPPADYQPGSESDVGQMEHHVWPTPDGSRLVKLTRPSQFGLWPVVQGPGWDMRAKDSTPLRYLSRFTLANTTFHDDTVLHGILVNRQGQVQILTSQPAYDGDTPGDLIDAQDESEQEHAREQQMRLLQSTFAQDGFYPVASSRSTYYRPADNTALFDAHLYNVMWVHTPAGLGLMPFDVVTMHPQGALQANLQSALILPASRRTPNLGSEDSITNDASNQPLSAASRTRRDADFSPGIPTPLGTLKQYTWQHKQEDVWNDTKGEYEGRRVSDWDKAVTNAETGRDIVHHFTVLKPDGNSQVVSLETALGSMPPEQKKSITGIMRSLRRLPVNEQHLQELKAKNAAFFESYDQAKKEGWKSAPAVEFQDPEFPRLRERGVKQAFVGKTFFRNYEPAESMSPGDIQEAKQRWAVENITVPALTYDEKNKLESLPRIIKKDRIALSTAGVSIQPLFASNRSPSTNSVSGSGQPLPTPANESAAALPPPQTSPLESAAAQTHPLPSLAQKLAGNYPKGKVTLHGLPISLENPRGSERSGRTRTGQEWSITMPHHYGYILGTQGKDKDHLDVFIGPDPDSQQVLIINQGKPPSTTVNGSAATLQPSQTPPHSAFDEHKIMLGFPTPVAALRGYLASYSPGWKGLQSAVPTTIPALKAWIATGKTSAPVTRAQFAKWEAAFPLVNTTPFIGTESGQPPSTTANGSAATLQPSQTPPSGPPLPASLRQGLAKANALDQRLGKIPGVNPLARALDRSSTAAGSAIKTLVSGAAKTPLLPIAALGTAAEFLHATRPLAAFGSNNLDKRVAKALARVAGPKITSAKQAAEAWLQQPDGLSPTLKGVVDQFLPNALMPREWLALKHEMDRKSAFGAERANDLIRALSGNPRLSDLAYPPEFATNPAYRIQLFDAMEGRIPMESLPPPMQQLAGRLRQMLRDTGEELVRQGLMNPDTFEELQASGWMPRYTEEEAAAAGGSFLAAFKLGIRDLNQQRSTAYHIVDTSRRDKTGQFLTVNREEKEAGVLKRNRWRFRDAASRDAYYSQLIREQALQELKSGGKSVQQMLAPLGRADRSAMREQISALDLESLNSLEKLSPMLRGIVKQSIEDQKSRFAKREPFIPEKLVKDPVYAIARYVLGQTHNAATAELMRATAANPAWVSDVDVQGFQKIPDSARFGPLAGKFLKDDIARQVLDLVDVPNAALKAYDGILRKWKAGKLVLNPGSHIRDAIGNMMFAYLGGSSIWNPGNWPHYRDAMALLRTGSAGATTYAELIEHGVLGGDAYSGLVKERLKGLLPDSRTIEDFNPGLVMRTLMGLGSKAHGAYEWASELRRFPDDFYKVAAYLKAKADFQQQPQTTVNHGQPPQTPAQQAAQHVRKWFPYYDRLGSSASTRAAGRFVNPFLSFFRESTRILGTAVLERPLALSAALAFPAALSALSAMLLGLSERDREEIGKDLAGRGKGVLGLGGFHLFSMLLPFRSSQSQVQQWDISSIMPFADLLGQKVVPLEEKENAFQTFWRQTMSAGPVFGLTHAWATNRDTFSGRHIVENDMPAAEMAAALGQHALGVLAPPLAPDVLHAIGIGEGGPLSKAGERQTNKTLQTYDPVQTIIRSVLGMNLKSAAPNLYRQADDFRRSLGLEVNPGYDYGTTVESRLKRALVQQLAKEVPSPTAIQNLVRRLKEHGIPLDTEKQINAVVKIIDPALLIGGSQKLHLSAEDARLRFRTSLPPESRALYETALSEYQKIKARAALLLRQ